MTEASGNGERRAPQEFERVLAAASTAQASFEEDQLPLLKRVQRFLHSHPTVVPFVVLMFGVVVAMHLMLTRTLFGLRVRQIGGNLEAARLSGVHIDRTRIGIFVISGFLVTASFERRGNLIAFAKARAARIYPGLIVCTLVSALLIGPCFTTMQITDYLRSSYLDFGGFRYCQAA